MIYLNHSYYVNVNMWSYNQVKKTFVEHFQESGHTFIPSSSVVPPNNDSSLLFVNSGMVQFKDIFLGKQETSLSRVCNTQKCIRAGGKHNDLGKLVLIIIIYLLLTSNK